MDCRLARGLVEAVAERLAVDRHHLSFGQLVQRGDPTYQAFLELGGLQCREHGVETVMRWNAIAEVEEFAQPVQLLNSNSAIDTKSSAPAMTAQMAMATMLIRG